MSMTALKLTVAGAELTCLRPWKIDTRCEVNRIGSARIVLKPDGSNAHNLWKNVKADAAKCEPGKAIKLAFEPLQGREVMLFSGVAAGPLNPIIGPDMAFVLEAIHPLQKLASSHRSQIFMQKTDRDIMAALLGDQGLKLGAVDGMADKHEQLVQWACSDWEWMRSRVAANPVWLIAGEESVSCTRPKLAAAALTLSAQRSDDAVSILEQDWARDSRAVPRQLSVSYWDLKAQKIEKVEAKTPKIGEKAFAPAKALNSKPWQLTHRLPLTKAEAQALADARLLALHLAAVQTRLTLKGNAKMAALEPGQTVELKGFEAFDGKGLITGVEHHWHGARWRTVVLTGQNVPYAASVDAGILPRVLGHASGVVDKFREDAAGLYRIQVSIPGLGDDKGKQVPLWARLGSAYASRDSGLCLYPEEGDEVVLAFMDDDPRFPVIVNAVHNPKSKPPFPPSKENAKKGLVLAKTKQQFVFDVEQNSVELKVDAETLDLTKDKGLAVHSKHNLNFDAGKSVAIQSADAVTVNSTGKSVSIDATKVQITAKQQLVLDGTMSAEIKGARVELKN